MQLNIVYDFFQNIEHRFVFKNSDVIWIAAIFTNIRMVLIRDEKKLRSAGLPKQNA